MAYCTNCGKETSAQKVCEHCGVKRNKAHKFCEWCGTAIEPKAKVCSNCGEPKKASSFIGKTVRIILAAFLLLYGLISFGDSAFLALFIALVGILLLPFAQRLFRKATHNNQKLRKMIARIATPVLAVLVFLSMHTCAKISNYEDAVESWDNKAYAAAMYWFNRYPDHKDAGTYIEKFENDVLVSLTQNPWSSDMEFCVYSTGAPNGYLQTRWSFCFNEDGSVLRRAQIWESTSSTTYRMVSYDDTTFSSYSLVYDINEETGIYEVLVCFGQDFEYVLTLGVDNDGEIVVQGLLGDMQVYEVNGSRVDPNSGKYFEQYFGKDTHLPE